MDFTSLKLISTCLHKGCLALIPGFIPICYAESFICNSDGYNRSGIRFWFSFRKPLPVGFLLHRLRLDG